MTSFNSPNKISFSRMMFNYTSKDFYKKYFFHKFRNFKSFSDQLEDMNRQAPAGTTYSYDGDIIEDDFDFRHLMFDYFFSQRTGVDADIEMGVGLDFATGEIPASSNNIPDFEILQWMPFTDIYKFEIPDYTDDDSSIYAAKSKKVSLHTYPSYFTTFNDEKQFNKNWFKHFRLNDEAQIEALENDGNVASPITKFYIHLTELDERYPLSIDQSNYTTSKKIDGTITNYDEVRAKISGLGDYSEINFDDPIWKINVDGDVETVESAWQLKDINGEKVLALCLSNDENNIVHERYSNGKLYAVNIPSENIYRYTSANTPVVEEIIIPLKNNMMLKSTLSLPFSGFNEIAGSTPDITDLEQITPKGFCQSNICIDEAAGYVDINEYLKSLTSSADLNSAITNLMYSRYIGKLMVMGKTNMKAKPFDPTRATAFDSQLFSTYADADGYIPLDILAKDLNRRISNYDMIGGPHAESLTYPYLDGNSLISYKLFSKFEIETHYYSGEVIDGEIYTVDSDYVLKLKVKSVPLSQIKNATSPMGNIFGSSSYKQYYNMYGEKNSLSDYMTSFRFFDPIVMQTNSNDSYGNLDPMFWFANRDTFGAHCYSMYSTFFNDVEEYKETLKAVTANDQTPADTTLTAVVNDLQVYFGMFMGQGLWQKGFEIIIDQNFSDNAVIKELFTDMSEEFQFVSIQHNLNDYDFTYENLPVSTLENGVYNLSHNTLVADSTIMPQLMFFIPWNYNNAKERWWLAEKALLAEDEETYNALQPMSFANVKNYTTCYVQYKEEEHTTDNCVKDYVNNDFETPLTRKALVDELVPADITEMLYCYRPARHYIKLYDGLYEDPFPGDQGYLYKFDFTYIYANDVANESLDDFWDYLMTTSYSLDRDLLDELMTQKQLTGTYYYHISNTGIDLILPDHSLYAYTVIEPGTQNPPVFFKPGESISLSIKGIFNNVDSVEILAPTVNEIVSGVSSQWNSDFRGVQTDFVRSQLVTGGTHFSSAISMDNEKAKDLKAPFGDVWVKIGDLTDEDYMGGYKLVNHNYYYPSEWALNGVFVTGKQWLNGTDLIYYSYNPTVAHFFIDEESDISYTLGKTGASNLNRLLSENKLYLGSFIIPPRGYINTNDNVINVGDNNQQSISLIKEKQNNDINEMKINLTSCVQENSRENLNGLMFTGYAVATQIVTLSVESSDDKALFNNIKEGMFVYQDDTNKGTVMKKIENSYTIVVKLYDAINMINNSSKLKFVF